MDNKDERYLNVTLKNEEPEDNEQVVISLSGFLNVLKRFLLIWIVAAIIIGILVPVSSAVFTADQHKNLTALVSFNYAGIENGLAPDGTSFDVNTLKNPSVIEATLTELGLPLTSLESIRQGITIDGVLPSDAIDRITMYRNIYEQGNLSAGEKMLDVKYFPTQYRLTFNYSRTGLTGTQPVTVFNTLLEKYRSYFLEQYGFNQALGSAVTAIDYTEYDYPEAIDVLRSTLNELEDYVETLSKSDTTRFRALSTGYTFSDLSEAVRTMQEVDLEILSSYITVNNVTKDKAVLLDYYNYRIETLARERSVAEDTLKGLNEAINNYKMNTAIIYAEGQDPTSYITSSEEYDALVAQKITQTTRVSSCTQQISEYQQRINTLKVRTEASEEKVAKVDNDLKALNSKIDELLNAVNVTANEYYETALLANAYSILVPASTSALQTTRNVISSAMETLLILEALLFVLYFGFSFVLSIVETTRKRRTEAAAEAKTETAAEKEE